MLVKFVYPIFNSESNHYCTYKYKNIETGKQITCVGYDLPSAPTKYDFTVEEVNHPTYGLQYKVISYIEHIGNDRESIIEYLASGLIKGIKQKTAEKIFAMFGTESIKILSECPEKLLKVKGISQNKLDEIVASYAENHIPPEIITYLAPLGFTIEIISTIYKVYREYTLKNIKENPFRMCNFKGVTFKMADVVSSKLNIKKTDYIRIIAAVQQALKNDLITGSVAMTKENLIKSTEEIASIYDDSLIWKCIIQGIKNENIAYRKVLEDNKVKQFIYLKTLKQIEESLADEIIRLVKCTDDRSEDAKKLLKQIKDDITLDQSQENAIVNVFSYMLSIITGGPGTGKTTTIKRIITLFRMMYPNEPVYLMAPTGKAARRITESTLEPAKTIHSQFGLSVHDEDHIEYDEDIESIESGLVIVDEMSMVDMALATVMFQGIQNGTRIAIVGDKDQIDSVKPGKVLKDMISSGVVPVTYLKYEHRQDDDTLICENAHRMQDDKYEFLEDDSFQCEYMDEKERTKNLSQIEKLQVIENYMTDDYVSELKNPDNTSVICLSPYKSGAAGVYALNKAIQNRLNPANLMIEDFQGHNEMVFRIGDPVMHIKKNYDDIVNGDVGIVVSIGMIDGEYSVTCEYDTLEGKVYHQYTKKNIGELTLAYAMTYHKTQGSEYDVVILCMTDYHRKMLRRNILYTGITRAKKKVKFKTTNKKVVKAIIQNNSEDERNTMLAFVLREKYGELYEQRSFSI